MTIEFSLIENGLCEARYNDAIIAKIRKIEFEHSISKPNKQFENSFLKVTAGSEAVSVIKYVSALPDLKGITFEAAASPNQDHAVISSLRNINHAIKRAITTLGCEISLGQAQELLAAFCNLQSWNHLKAVEKRLQNTSLDPAVYAERSDGQTRLRFYASFMDGLRSCHSELGRGKHLQLRLLHGSNVFNIVSHSTIFDRHWLKTALFTPFNDNDVSSLFVITQIDLYEDINSSLMSTQ